MPHPKDKQIEKVEDDGDELINNLQVDIDAKNELRASQRQALEDIISGREESK